MGLWLMVMRSLSRRKAKAVFIILGLTVGVAAMAGLSVLSDALTTQVNQQLEKYGANILITPKSKGLSLVYEGMNLGGFSYETAPLYEKDLGSLKTIKNSGNIAAVGPMLLGTVRVKDTDAPLAGVDFIAMDYLRPWWQVTGRLPARGEVLAGDQAARVLDLKLGDRMDLGGQTLTVAGVLAPTGSPDDQLLFADRPMVETLLNQPGRLSMVEVAALCHGCPVEEMVAQIEAAWPGASVMAIQSVVKGRMHALSLFKRFSWGAGVLVTVVGGLVVLVTMMASVRERSREIGLWRAIGFRRSHVVRLVLMESLVLSLAAGLLGLGLGLGGAWLLMPLLVDGHGGHLTLNPGVALFSLALSLVMGQLAGIHPALAAARMDPSEALRSL